MLLRTRCDSSHLALTLCREEKELSSVQMSSATGSPSSGGSWPYVTGSVPRGVPFHSLTAYPESGQLRACLRGAEAAGPLPVPPSPRWDPSCTSLGVMVTSLCNAPGGCLPLSAVRRCSRPLRSDHGHRWEPTLLLGNGCIREAARPGLSQSTATRLF